MKNVIRYFLTAACLMILTVRAGEPETFNGVKGVILDESSNPVEMATVTLVNMSDSSQIKGAVTAKDGSFSIGEVRRGRYKLDISCLGYKKVSLTEILISDKQPEVNIGSRKLEPAQYQTKSAQITGERAAEEYKADKKVINVSQNLNATGGTALDALQNQPSVRVDADGTVYLRGSSNFVVQVNGRPAVMQGADALRQIPANSIEQIELITNPSASHEAEGSAGIINIILKKQIENNFNGIFNTGAGARDKYSTDAALNYKKDNINLSGGYDYRNNANFVNQNIGRQSVTLSGGQETLTDLDIRIKRENYSGRANMDYSLDDGSVLSVGGNAGKINVDLDFNTKLNNQIGTTPAVYGKNVQKTDISAEFYNATASYSKSFTPKVDELSLDGSVSRVLLPNTELASQYKTDAYYTPLNNNPAIRLVNNDAKRWDGRLKGNYKYNFSEKSTFEAGFQSNFFFKNIDYIYSNYDYTTAEYTKSDALSNVFKITNNVHAVFATYSNEFAGVQYQVGLRAEYTDRLLKQTTLGDEFAYRKTHYFPSVNFTTGAGAGQQIQFSYSRRITRPFDQQLNPYATYSDEYTISRGNPYLLPEFTNSFELNYQRNFAAAFLSAQFYLRLTEDGINNTFSNQNGKLIITFANSEKRTAAGTEISGSIPLTAWWKLDPAVNIFNNHVITTVENLRTDANMFTWNAQVSSNFVLAQGTRLQLMGYYFARNLLIQGEVSPFVFWSLTLRQEFLERRLVATLSAQNLFNSMSTDIKSRGLDFSSMTKIKNESPVLMLSLSYNFNNYRKTARPNEGVDVNVGTGL